MKVVIFCGGLGLRMGGASARLPKPMVPVADRPILWHIMSYYASFGHTEFVLCAGYKAHVIEKYFRTYNGDSVESGWSIEVVETGIETVIGQRLKAVEPYVDDDVFLATYGDGLTDAPLPALIERLEESDAVGLFLAARPTAVFHLVGFDDDGVVRSLADIGHSDVWQNAGYFVFQREIFDYIGEGEDLVDAPLQRLIAEGRLLVYPHEGFWAPMDTFKDKQTLDLLAESGAAPWRCGPRRPGARPLPR